MIELKDVERSYKTGPTETWVLRRIGLTIKEGEFITVMGPSGAGKSSLLNVLALLDDSWKGEYWFGETAVHKLNRKQRADLARQRIGMVFQSYHLLDDLTVAENIDLQDFILMSRGERKDTGRAREVILANAIEAVIGAIYLDQGFDKTRVFIESFVLIHLDEVLKTRSYKDAKSELQEIIQERLKVTPTYSVRGETGPAHERRFTMGVYFGDKLIAEGEGLSKQDAEIEAAKNALKKYGQ